MAGVPPGCTAGNWPMTSLVFRPSPGRHWSHDSAVDPPVNQGRDEETSCLQGVASCSTCRTTSPTSTSPTWPRTCTRCARPATRHSTGAGRPWTIEHADWFTDVERLRPLVGRIVGTDAEGIALIPATSRTDSRSPRATCRRGRRADRGPGRGVPVGHLHLAAARARDRCGAGHGRPGTARQSWTEAILDVPRRADVRSSACPTSTGPTAHWSSSTGSRRAAHELDARLVIDASQSVGAMPLDVTALRPDFVISVGYKWLLGPFGLGYL